MSGEKWLPVRLVADSFKDVFAWIITLRQQLEQVFKDH